jgi:hypothetical protein
LVVATVSQQRLALEALWRSRLDEPQSEYRRTAGVTREALALLDLLAPERPDGQRAFQAAYAAEMMALEKYQRTVETLNALVIHGKMVPEE